MATFGITAPGATNAINTSNGFGGTKATLPVDGYATKISLNCWNDNTSNTGRARMAIYTDSAGVPGTLVAVSSETAFSNAGATDWNDFTLPAPVHLVAADYWMMIWNGPHTGANKDRRGFNTASGAFRFVSANITYSSSTNPTSPCPTTSTANQQTACYVTYDATPVNSAAPSVSGLTPVGSTLTTTNGTWSNSPTFTYQWTSDGVNIGGATSSTYVTVTGDIGHAIGCKVTATNGVAFATQASSNTVTVGAAAGLYVPGFRFAFS